MNATKCSNYQCITASKISKYGVIPGPHFPVIGLNTEIHFINCRSQSEYGEIWTRKTPYLDTFYTVYGTKNSILNSNLRQKQKG